MSRFRHERILRGVVHGETGSISLRALEARRRKGLDSVRLFDSKGKQIKPDWKTVRRMPKTREEVVARIAQLRKRANAKNSNVDKLNAVLPNLEKVQKVLRNETNQLVVPNDVQEARQLFQRFSGKKHKVGDKKAVVAISGNQRLIISPTIEVLRINARSRARVARETREKLEKRLE